MTDARRGRGRRRRSGQQAEGAADGGAEARPGTGAKARSKPETGPKSKPKSGPKAKPKSEPRTGPAAQQRVTGTYGGHSRGFGFLVLDGGGEDLFVPPKYEGEALDGDRVEAERGDQGTARVTRVLERGRKQVVGTYLGNGRVRADAQRIPKELVVISKTSLSIRRSLGRAGDPDVEDTAVLVELGITPGFPKAVQSETKRLEAPGERDLGHRLDLRKATTVVTIDPVTSRDFDDAVSLEREGDDWVLGVHIADVSHYVKPDSALDREAYRRGTSVYLPGRVIPMLPEKLSNDLCSLREGVDRLAMTVLMRYGPDGELRETTFAEAVIRSDRRFSYERASRVMDKAAREKGEVGTLLLGMVRLAKLLKRRRRSFDMPRHEMELVYGGRGEVVDVSPTADDVAHGVIEEFMLAANREVARLLLRKRVPTLYRHHPRPDDLTQLWRDLATLGARKPASLGIIKSMAAAVAKGHGPAATAAILRCMPRAIYTTRHATHSSLGFEAYTHFTSPIRRYSDLVVHRDVRALIQANGGPLKLRPASKLPAPTTDDDLETVGAHATERAISAERAEGRIRRRRLLEFLSRLAPQTLTGQITLVVEKGFSVDLPRYGTWGFVPVEQLPRGEWRFDAGVFQGANGSLGLGTTLDVKINRIDPSTNELELRLA